MRQIRRLVPALLLLAAAGACDEGTGPDTGAAESVDISPAADTLAALQDTTRLLATVRDRSGRVLPDVSVRWTSLEPEVASVDSTGRVVARGVGAARIVAASGELADTAEVTVLPGVSSAALDFVRLAADAPPLVTRDTSLWAVRGDGRELAIRFRGENDEDEDEGEEFLEFRIPGDALLRYPDGRPFEPGDSVRIRVRIPEDGRFQFDFEPSGLRFDPEHPAELRVRYGRAQGEDLAREDSVFLWRREREVDPWVRIATVRVKDLDEIRAEITGFTAFSLAIP